MKSAFLIIVNPESLDGSIGVGYSHGFVERKRTEIPRVEAESLIDAFASLPPGGGDLCFLPVFVVELRDHDVVQWSGAACFDCGTYYSTDRRGPADGTFDQLSDDAKQLLDRLRSLA